MKASCKVYVDGCAVFLESQYLKGGSLMVKKELAVSTARQLVDELNWAIRCEEERQFKDFADSISEPKTDFQRFGDGEGIKE
jgi:hypothetical protein